MSAPGMVAYSTTKFAAVGIAEALRVEVEPHVSVVCPGYVKTNLHRATRYANDAVRRFLDDPPRCYRMTDRVVGRAIADAVESRRDLVVLGRPRDDQARRALDPATLARLIADAIEKKRRRLVFPSFHWLVRCPAHLAVALGAVRAAPRRRPLTALRVRGGLTYDVACG